MRKGFTLIELLVVVSIIGLLATVILAALGSVRVKTRNARRQADMKSIQNALEIYYLDNGQYPGTGANFFAFSNDTSWETLEGLIGSNLPSDPINETGTPTSTAIGNTGTLTYSYMSFNHAEFGCGNRQTYMLIFISESGEGGGAIGRSNHTCHTPPRNYGQIFNPGSIESAHVYSSLE